MCIGHAGQTQRDERLFVLPVPAVGHHQELGRIKIDDPAVQDGGLSLGMHHPTAFTAHTKIDLGHGRRHIHRSPPVHQVSGVGVCAEHPVDVGRKRTLQSNRLAALAHCCSSDK
jgi:hypothetical protein